MDLLSILLLLTAGKLLPADGFRSVVVKTQIISAVSSSSETSQLTLCALSCW